MAKLQLRVLYREFLFRVIDLELLAPQGDISKLLGQFAALLLFVGLWVLLPAVIMTDGPPSELSLLLTWTTEHFIIATTMLVGRRVRGFKLGIRVPGPARRNGARSLACADADAVSGEGCGDNHCIEPCRALP
jgi:hypothetical protein